ncbi:copper resistance protein CopC [Marinobacter sp.]|uniref:copper resistance CopC family protein n=1 Tax=Marinobacter sp. TaxID=50741 RepID=UPI0019E730C0|nr:copper resistance protein CopC [Marinobacter sp.]MBE0486059.1 copper resistance protein CopC [Marinobacter sp.]
MNRHIFLPLMLMIFALTGASLAHAHTDVISSSPASDEHIETSPEYLGLEFGDNVRLMRVNLTDGDGQRVRVDFRPSRESNMDYRIDLPTLKEGHYEVEWRAMADDGHTMTGGFSFHLGGNPDDHKSNEDSGSGHEGHH